MVFCNYCRCETDVEIDDAKGISCCTQCGRVLEDIAFSADVTFQKDAAGESTVVGQFVNESGVARGIGRIHGGRVYAYQADSHERAQQRGRQDIAHLVDQLSVRPREETIESAHRLYKLALTRGFTRGRRTNQVAAACLYLVCRQDKKPFLLIDFSDALQVNVFTLGAVFLQLAKLLRLEEHPLFSKPVDPSLYIHRFADRMNFPNRQMLDKVAATAMRLVASMKRDWIQTGRRPSGVCGAALYIAAHLHGFARTKKEVVTVVHIGEHTLAKRLNEFTTTEAGSLTRIEFENRIDHLAKKELEVLEGEAADDAPEKMLAACEHIGHGEAHFKHGMCRACYTDFVKDTGGTYDGANPPAFARNRMAEAKKAEVLALPAPGDKGKEEDAGPAKDGEATLLLENGEAAPAAGLSARAQRAAKRRGTSGLEKASAAADDGDSGLEEQGRGPGLEEDLSARPYQPPPLVDPKAVQAAEEQVMAFDAAIAEAEETGSRKRRRGWSTAAAVAAATAAAVQEAALGAGADAEGAAAAAGAIVPTAQGTTALPAIAAGDFGPAGEGGGEGAQEAEEASLSDIEDAEIEMYLADEEEVRCKEELWDLMNQDWVEKQEAKKAAIEAAERAQEEQRAAMEAAAAAGVQYKRGRGRPLGSKTKPKPEINLPPAETPQEAAMRMLDHKRLSSKINYNVLAGLFSDDAKPSVEAAGAGPSGSAPPVTTTSPRKAGRPRVRPDASKDGAAAAGPSAIKPKEEDDAPSGSGAGAKLSQPSRLAGLSPRAPPRAGPGATGRLGGLNEGFGRERPGGLGSMRPTAPTLKGKGKAPSTAKKVTFAPKS